jgi:hypothetical protein
VSCSALPYTLDDGREEAARVLLIGDDWAEDHHDVEIVDSDGKRPVSQLTFTAE